MDERFAMTRSVCRVVAAMLILLSLVAEAQQPETGPTFPERYVFENWAQEHGLPQVSVSALAQDDDGYLWAGTKEGLARFDGLRFTIFDRRNTPELGSNEIRALATDGDGSLWIATRAGLSRLRDGRFARYTTADGLAADDVLALHVDRSGALWIGTVAGLSRFAEGGFRTWSRRDGLVHDVVWALHEGRGGALWIGTEKGLSRFDGERFTSYTTADGLVADRVLALHEDPRGGLWIGTLNGLSRFDGERFRTYTAADGLAHPTVSAIYEDRDGQLWIGTDMGLNRLDGERLVLYGRELGLPERRVSAFLEDDEGSLWLGTGIIGVARVRRARIAAFGTADGLVDDLVWVIYEDRRGNVWIGSNEGLTRLAPDGSVTRYTPADGLPDEDVRALYEDRHGDLWIGTVAHGLARLKGFPQGARRKGEIRPAYTLGNGLAGPGVFALQEDREGRLWIGTDGGLNRREEDGSLTTFTTADGLSQNRVQTLHLDTKGTLWIGTEDGLDRVEGDGVVPVVVGGEPLRAFVKAVHVDREGVAWIGTAEDGLLRLQDGKLDRFAEPEGLFDHLVHRILEDDTERLWMSSNKGIFSVRKAELKAQAAGEIAAVTSIAFDMSDGMPAGECNGGGNPAGTKSRDGRLWFPTIAGVAILDPAELTPNRVPPPVHVTEVLVDGETVPADEAATLAPGTQELELRYVALSFTKPESVRFRYRLEGFQREWVDAGARRAAYYTNLNPGSYRFQVIARNSDGAWNETGGVFEFVLEPSIYETWYFWAACAVGFLFAGRGVHRLLVRGLLRHNRELRQVRGELEAKNAELERFTYTVSHDLKSPLFTIQGFVGLAERDAREGRHDRLATDFSQIKNAATKMQQLLEDLLDLSRVGRVSNRPEDVALRDLVDEALELVEGRIAERGVEVEVAPDLGVVHGDRPRLREVFQNLIDNAVKYMGAQEEPRVAVAAEARGEMLLCSVRDNGAGIDPRYQERIFDLFEQLDPENAGSGIGLALVRRIVEVHGGEIRVESDGEGRGTTFFFTLPRGGS